VAPNPIIGLVINRSHFQPDGLQVPKSLFDQAEFLVGSDPFLLGHPLSRQVGVNHVAAIKDLLGLDGFLVEVLTRRERNNSAISYMAILTLLSAAQPQSNDRGEINAFVSSCALGRAALKGATSSLKGGRSKSRIIGRTIRR